MVQVYGEAERRELVASWECVGGKKKPRMEPRIELTHYMAQWQDLPKRTPANATLPLSPLLSLIAASNHLSPAIHCYIIPP